MTEGPTNAIESTLHSADGKGLVRMKATYATDIDDVWSAITDPQRLARWYGKVEGDLRVGGEYTAYIPMSGWDGRGRIDACEPPRRLRVTTWEEEGKEQVVTVELSPDGDSTSLEIEVRGTPLDLVWAYGVGWQIHVENLGVHLAGDECATSDARWDELEPTYRAMTVTPLEG